MSGGRPYDPQGDDAEVSRRSYDTSGRPSEASAPKGEDLDPVAGHAEPSCAAGRDASQLELVEASQRRLCEWCGGPLPARARRDRRTCSTPCRQAKARFSVAPAATTADRARRFAYADPPYPGCAKRYYNCEEVDHAELLADLCREYPDGWALSTSAEALPEVLALAVAAVRKLGSDPREELRTCVWLRGGRRVRRYGPHNVFEALIVWRGRPRLYAPENDASDVLIWGGRQHSHPGALVGMKPAAFAEWMFMQLGAAVGDELVDLFPGSGAIGRAWALFVASDVGTEVSQAADRDIWGNPRDDDDEDASRLDDGFELVGDYVPDADMHLFLLPEQRPPLRSRLKEANAKLRDALDDSKREDGPF